LHLSYVLLSEEVVPRISHVLGRDAAADRAAAAPALRIA
jgi:hypothetical protein